MMNLIDRYIVSLFVRVFVICFLSLMGMYVVADFVNNLHELLTYGKTEGGLLRVILKYYGPQVPWFFDMISRIIALIAAVFAVTRLQKNNEFAAIMAAGISRWRVLKPLVVCVGAISLFAALNREFVIPQLGRQLGRDARNLAGDRTEPLHPRYDHATRIFFGGDGILPGTQQVVAPKFRLPNEWAPEDSQVVAATADYLAASPYRPAGYLLQKVTRPPKLAEWPSIRMGERTVVYSPADTDWLGMDQVFVATDLPFSHLHKGDSWRRFASTLSLIRGVRNPSLDYGADVSVTIHARLLQPFLDLTLLFIGLPIVVARESRNPFVSAGSCLIVVAGFLGAVAMFQGLGMNYLISPSLAAWGPLFLFVPWALFFSEPLRR